MTTKLKISLLAFIAILFFQTNAFAQWDDTGTNIWTNDKVGIGFSDENSSYRLTVASSSGNGISSEVMGNKAAVRGASQTGIGVYGRTTSNNGKAIYGHDTNGLGYAGFFSGKTMFTGNMHALSSSKQAIFRCSEPGGEGPYLHFYGLDYTGDVQRKGRISFVSGGSVESPGIIAFVNKEGNQYNQIMTILGDQKQVGIGTTIVPDGYKLAVKDGVITNKIKVESCDAATWCDYVFTSEYKLMPLVEVEKHIDEKGHLHNTPSAKEIKEDGGFEVGEITLNQQEKIEEVFLHLIELNNKIEELVNENEELKKQVNELSQK